MLLELAAVEVSIKQGTIDEAEHDIHVMQSWRVGSYSCSPAC